MQTFLPYSNFVSSAKVLDNKRLGKQRVEAMQIHKALVTGKGWIHHPITKMWRGYENTLLQYGQIMCIEWQKRGFKNTMTYFDDEIKKHLGEVCAAPPWLGNEEFHKSHRSNLSRKDLIHYSQYWNEDPTMLYLWYDMELGRWFRKTAEMKKKEYLES